MSDLVGDARHLSPSAQEALRLRAVAALVAGRDREDVAAGGRQALHPPHIVRGSFGGPHVRYVLDENTMSF
ncbi:hypothetical protein QF026_007541 [Streptomyces aurantiacus]|uniref:hypothetical protein n=1 Tax=Streptomyces aurantiacus TaxID=47760 RepID=UPI002790599F|nr:hypothetical protein [Streptomyces aurantiacus]MDQ0779075.1 hypothetical protein [Streptomyces aurantiacus]